jgi:hypothetical protein
MKITSQVKCDLKGINNLIRRSSKLDDYHVEFGFFDDKQHSSGMTVAELARTLNYGTDEIPERPFMQDSINSMNRWMDTSKQWRMDIWNYLKNGGRIDILMKKYGRIGVDTIQAIFYNNNYPENNQLWAAYKQATYSLSIPLIETHELYNATEFRVVRSTK